MDLKNIKPGLKERAKACATTEELLALAAEEGIELTDDELEGISGGWDHPCIDDVPGCGSYTGE